MNRHRSTAARQRTPTGEPPRHVQRLQRHDGAPRRRPRRSDDIPCRAHRSALRRAVPGAQHRRRAPARKPAAGRGGAGRQHLRADPQFGGGLRRAHRAGLPAQRRSGRRAGPPVVRRAARRRAPDRQPAAFARRRAGRRGRRAAARLPRIPPGAVGRRGGGDRAAAQSAARRREARLAAAHLGREGAHRLGLGRRVRHLVEGARSSRPGCRR